jgi:FlaA1/EpsC-like NDP-sugar epimerase
LSRQIARLRPGHLIVVDHAEYNLYNIHQELESEFSGFPFRCHLADICDQAAVDHIFAKWKPEIVFHAAAYKHVTMLEGQMREAVRNNILGTRTMAAAAERWGCAKFVLISTDKAVNPANVMGATKRVAESWCHASNSTGQTRFITVRFGNVLGSAGSVVPLFQRQIDRGGPVTVTNPEVTRFFMTIPEACLLIMQAGVMGKGGEIFVLDMGQPIKIADLAEQMIRLSGKIPGKDIEIVYTGLRPGEKLSEELFYDQENLSATSHEKILLARHNEVNWTFLSQKLNDIEAACKRYDVEQMQRILHELVPGLIYDTETDDNVIEFKRANA